MLSPSVNTKIADIKIKMIPVLVAPRGRRLWLTVINSMCFILIFVENCLFYDALHEFSVWLRSVY